MRERWQKLCSEHYSLSKRQEHKYYLIIYTLAIVESTMYSKKKLQRAAKSRQHHMSRNGGANASWSGVARTWSYKIYIAVPPLTLPFFFRFHTGRAMWPLAVKTTIESDINSRVKRFRLDLRDFCDTCGKGWTAIEMSGLGVFGELPR